VIKEEQVGFRLNRFPDARNFAGIYQSVFGRHIPGKRAVWVAFPQYSGPTLGNMCLLKDHGWIGGSLRTDLRFGDHFDAHISISPRIPVFAASTRCIPTSFIFSIQYVEIMILALQHVDGFSSHVEVVQPGSD
jgi:hypothetical protein